MVARPEELPLHILAQYSVPEHVLKRTDPFDHLLSIVYAIVTHQRSFYEIHYGQGIARAFRTSLE